MSEPNKKFLHWFQNYMCSLVYDGTCSNQQGGVSMSWSTLQSVCWRAYSHGRSDAKAKIDRKCDELKVEVERLELVRALIDRATGDEFWNNWENERCNGWHRRIPIKGSFDELIEFWCQDNTETDNEKDNMMQAVELIIELRDILASGPVGRASDE